MIGRREFAAAGLSVAALAAMRATGLAQEQPLRQRAEPRHDEHNEAFQECAKACSDCQRACATCATHCAHQLHAGKEEHYASLASCLDCADFCASAAQITARGGPFVDLICASCAEACAHCAKACEAFPDDKHMAACAKECLACEKACREMLEHSGHGHEHQEEVNRRQ